MADSEQSQRLQFMVQLVGELHQITNLEDAYTTALNGIQHILGTENSALFLLNEAGLPHLAAWRGLPSAARQAVDGYLPWPETPPPCSPLLYENLAKVGQLNEWQQTCRAAGLHALAFIPLVSQERLLGYYLAAYSQPHTFSSEEIEALQIVASQAAVAIDRIQSREQIVERMEKRLALLKQQITQRREAEAALWQESAIVRLLQEIATAANELDDVTAVYQLTLDKICAHTGWPLGHVCLLSVKGDIISGGIWHVQDADHFREFTEITETTRLPAGVGWPGVVFSTGKPAWIMNPGQHPDFIRRRGLADIEVMAGFAFPVMVGTKVAAVLEFFTTEAKEPDEALLEVMGHIGTQLGRVVERHEANVALHHNEMLLAEAQRLAHLGSWEWDVVRDKVTWSDELYRIYGLRPENFGAAYESYLAHIHPDDRDHVQQIVQEASEQKRPFSFYHRIVRPNGEIRIVHGRGHPELDEAGTLVRMYGTSQDVTENKQIEAKLQQARYTAEMLRTANVALTQSLNLETILNILLDYLEQVAGFSSALILLKEWGGRFRLQAVRGETGSLAPGQTLDLQSFTTVQEILTQQKSLLLSGDAYDPGWLPHLEEVSGMKSGLGVPLLTGSKVIGLCGLCHTDPRHFTAEDVKVIEALATQAASAIQNAQLFNQVQTGRERLRRLAGGIVSAQEEERRRISRELHDEASQVLTALKLSLELTLAGLSDVPHPIRANLGEAIEMADETMERMRLLAHGLRPPALDKLGLKTALASLCEDVANRAQLSISYTADDPGPLPDSVSISIYRFVQEALTNTVKHAGATAVQVTLHQDREEICVVVTDNGQGLPSVEQADDLLPQFGGVGLTGLQERLELLGGHLEITSKPGQGTQLMAHIPWAEEGLPL